ncbi:unnamed protein product [Rotaria sp. Silwood1]|nr:unnamed protein product [Rotaria sp. Silwood1]
MSASVITTSIDTHEIIASTITATNADNILGDIFETRSTTRLSTSTTSKKSSKTSKPWKTVISTTSVISFNRLSPTEKSSSYIKYLILLFLIIGIIVLILCLLYLYRHNRNSDNESLSDRDDSDELYNSVKTQIESDSSNESVEETVSTHAVPELSIPVQQQEQSKISRKQTSGLFFSKLDPDIL